MAKQDPEVNAIRDLKKSGADVTTLPMDAEELKALGKACTSLAKLDGDARVRVVNYVQARNGEE